MNSDRRVRTTSSTPPSSPALTMFTKRRLKTFGCCARPSEKVLPPSIESASSPMIRLRVGFRFLLFEHAQAAQQRQAGIDEGGQLPGESGQDLGFNLPAKPGDLDVDAKALFFCPGFGAAFGLLLALLFGLVHLDDLGREQSHFLDAADGLVLVGDFEGAFRFPCHGSPWPRN